MSNISAIPTKQVAGGSPEEPNLTERAQAAIEAIHSLINDLHDLGTHLCASGDVSIYENSNEPVPVGRVFELGAWLHHATIRARSAHSIVNAIRQRIG